ncbi:hypothetical protein ACFP1H_00065 [Secundilactobacillus hailunensis]|uniref:S-layer protein n=1 Tax=Secundilactobacillus hailunensis TaxID=2559923 RepID=A0ABW1T5Z8_9LACO|nr:hypothetical protein [Secundilactobacillus hailunensis]
MQSSLKKSLYLGLAAVSFVAVAGTTSANASAKAATAGAYSALTTNANVNLTGKNAVYTKPGTVKGAKVVATTATATKLNASKNGSANFRAYGYKTTDRGSVYYKVVSFDKAYRGYVYGGKKVNSYSGGLTAYATTKDATAPKATDNFKLTANTSSTANTLFYAQPAYAQYRVGRAKVNGSVLAATDKYKDASFTFDKAATTSREGETWYEIASTTLANGSQTPELNGAWVKASNVSDSQGFDAQSQVRVNVKDVATGQNVTTFNFTTGLSNPNEDAVPTIYHNAVDRNSRGWTSNFATALVNATKGSGYQVYPKDAVNDLSNVKNGSDITLYAVKNGQASMTVNAFGTYDGSTSPVQLKNEVAGKVYDQDSAKGVIKPVTTTLFSGTEGTTFSAADALNYIKGNDQLKTLNSPDFRDTTDQKVYHYVLTPQSATAGTFAKDGKFQVNYTATKVLSTTDNSASNVPGLVDPIGK